MKPYFPNPGPMSRTLCGSISWISHVIGLTCPNWLLGKTVTSPTSRLPDKQPQAVGRPCVRHTRYGQETALSCPLLQRAQGERGYSLVDWCPLPGQQRSATLCRVPNMYCWGRTPPRDSTPILGLGRSCKEFGPYRERNHGEFPSARCYPREKGSDCSKRNDNSA